MDTESPRKEEILVVDDVKDNVHFLMDMLSGEGYRVRPALSGEAALALLENDIPDLILLDIMMPGMDGYEACRRIQQTHREVPIIFLSALDEVADKVKGFAEGGVDYITKPFQTEEVLARIRTHLSIKHLQADLIQKNAHLQELNQELTEALQEIKILKGILPICANCKKIRDENRRWQPIEVYIQARSAASFSHSICPDCAKILYPEYSNR